MRNPDNNPANLLEQVVFGVGFFLMAEQDTITREGFSQLLDWLDPDVDQAGSKYEVIRTRLTHMFSCRGCHEPELLADQTMDRVARKMAEFDLKTESNPIDYFYRVSVLWLKVTTNFHAGNVPGLGFCYQMCIS